MARNEKVNKLFESFSTEGKQNLLPYMNGLLRIFGVNTILELVEREGRHIFDLVLADEGGVGGSDLDDADDADDLDFYGDLDGPSPARHSVGPSQQPVQSQVNAIVTDQLLVPSQPPAEDVVASSNDDIDSGTADVICADPSQQPGPSEANAIVTDQPRVSSQPQAEGLLGSSNDDIPSAQQEERQQQQQEQRQLRRSSRLRPSDPASSPQQEPTHEQ